jgi:signal peptidase II
MAEKNARRLFHFPTRLRFLWLTLVVALVDRLTKALIESQTPEGWRHELIPNFIYLVHSANPGIAFSFFASSTSPWTRVALISVSIVVIVVLAWLIVKDRTGSSLTAAGLALLLAGATGNVTDRIIHGAVTDFLEILFGSYHYPAFNVADSAIAIGAAFIVVDTFLIRKTIGASA